MCGCGSKSGESESSEDGGYNSVTLGDVMFIKLCGNSWWPAQVSSQFSCFHIPCELY